MAHHLDRHATKILAEAERLPDDQLLRVEEVADLFQVSPQTLHVMRHEGRGPPWVKLGHTVRYRRAELVAWLSSRVVASTAIYRKRPSSKKAPTE